VWSVKKRKKCKSGGWGTPGGAPPHRSGPVRTAWVACNPQEAQALPTPRGKIVIDHYPRPPYCIIAPSFVLFAEREARWSNSIAATIFETFCQHERPICSYLVHLTDLARPGRPGDVYPPSGRCQPRAQRTRAPGVPGRPRGWLPTAPPPRRCSGCPCWEQARPRAPDLETALSGGRAGGTGRAALRRAPNGREGSVAES
jgi:hypothetical protein